MVRRIVVGASIDVSATAEQTFRWVTDPALVPQWVQDLVESRPASDSEPIREGSRSVEVIQVGRNRMEVPAEVTALVPDRLVENRLEMPDGASTSRVEVTKRAGGCTVTLTMEAEIAGMRLLPMPVLARMLTLRLRSDLRRLKARVEGG